MNEVSPQNEREVVERSASADSTPKQETGGIVASVRKVMEKLGMLPPKKRGDITEHIRYGRSPTQEEIYNIDPRKDTDAEAQKSENR